MQKLSINSSKLAAAGILAASMFAYVSPSYAGVRVCGERLKMAKEENGVVNVKTERP